jgi:hypothetical protein
VPPLVALPTALPLPSGPPLVESPAPVLLFVAVAGTVLLLVWPLLAALLAEPLCIERLLVVLRFALPSEPLCIEPMPLVLRFALPAGPLYIEPPLPAAMRFVPLF